jgi:hypothetical protein
LEKLGLVTKDGHIINTSTDKILPDIASNKDKLTAFQELLSMFGSYYDLPMEVKRGKISIDPHIRESWDQQHSFDWVYTTLTGELSADTTKRIVGGLANSQIKGMYLAEQYKKKILDNLDIDAHSSIKMVGIHSTDDVKKLLSQIKITQENANIVAKYLKGVVSDTAIHYHSWKADTPADLDKSYESLNTLKGYVTHRDTLLKTAHNYNPSPVEGSTKNLSGGGDLAEAMITTSSGDKAIRVQVVNSFF